MTMSTSKTDSWQRAQFSHVSYFLIVEKNLQNFSWKDLAGYMHGPRGSEVGTASNRVCEFSCGRGSATRGSGKMTPKEL